MNTTPKQEIRIVAPRHPNKGRGGYPKGIVYPNYGTNENKRVKRRDYLGIIQAYGTIIEK